MVPLKSLTHYNSLIIFLTLNHNWGVVLCKKWIKFSELLLISWYSCPMRGIRYRTFHKQKNSIFTCEWVTTRLTILVRNLFSIAPTQFSKPLHVDDAAVITYEIHSFSCVSLHCSSNNDENISQAKKIV